MQFSKLLIGGAFFLYSLAFAQVQIRRGSTRDLLGTQRSTPEQSSPQMSIPVQNQTETIVIDERSLQGCRATGSSDEECYEYFRRAAQTPSPTTTEQTSNSEAIDCGPTAVSTGSQCVIKEEYCKTCSGADCENVCSVNKESATNGGVKCKPGEQLNATKDGCEPITDEKKKEETASSSDMCSQAVEAVKTDCDSTSKSWMKEANSMATQLKQASGTSASVCSGIGAASAATQSSLAYFSVTCNESYKSCRTSCAAQPESLKICESMGVKGKEAQQQAAVAMREVMTGVQQCQAAFGGQNDPCAISPTSIACKGYQTLTGPNAQPVQNNALMNTNPQGLEHQGAGGDGGVTAGSKGYGGDDFDSGEDGFSPHASAAGAEIGGSKGGGGIGSGSGGSAATGGTGGAGGGAGGNGEEGGTKILSGFFGGGGGGGSGGFGSRLGRGLKGLFGMDEEKMAQKEKTPDLRQFMPGGMQDPRKHRGIAGEFIGKDGMSGPHANIWALINNRYQHKRPTLLP